MKRRNAVVMMFAVLTVSIVPVASAQSGGQGASTSERPRLVNVAEVQESFNRHYSAALRKQGVAGVAQMRLFVGTRGAVDSVQLTAGTGTRDLDKAAVSIARTMRFSAAQVAGEARGVWIDLPITFQAPARIPSPSVNTITLANREEIVEAIRIRYPKVARDADIAAEVEVWVQIDATGSVLEAALERSTCLREVDQAAYDVAWELRFVPTQEDGGSIAGWTTVKLRFNLEGFDEYAVALEGEKKPENVLKSDSAHVKKPDLKNRAEIAHLMAALYPVDLRDARIGGKTTVWVWIDEKGAVARRMVSQGSGYCQLDNAALAVTKAMRFSPAQRNGEPIAVWSEFPISFRVQ